MPECKGKYRQSIRDKIYNLLTPRGRVKVEIDLLNLPPDRGYIFFYFISKVHITF